MCPFLSTLIPISFFAWDGNNQSRSLTREYLVLVFLTNNMFSSGKYFTHIILFKNLRKKLKTLQQSYLRYFKELVYYQQKS